MCMYDLVRSLANPAVGGEDWGHGSSEGHENAQKKLQIPFDRWCGANSENVVFIHIGRWP